MMAKRHHTMFENSLFSLDLKGEGYIPEPEDDLTDWSINVKEKRMPIEPLSEKVEILEIPSATYIASPKVFRDPLSKKEAELYRKTVLDVRKFIYNSIVCEDFCVSCVVSKDKGYALSHVSDVSDVESDTRASTTITSSHMEDMSISSPSMSIIYGGGDGSKNLPRVENPTTETDAACNSSDSRVQSAVGEGDTDSRGMNEKNDDVVSLTGLRTKRALNDVEGGADGTVEATVDDCIRLTVNIKKLSNIVTDIEHVQMCSSVPFPRLFRLSRENLSSGLLAAGRRYFLASDNAKSNVRSICHKSFLAHLYRRKRSVCFFCGTLKCPRTISSKQQCENMRCHRCSFIHKWGKKRCQDNGSMVQYYLKSNDWRNKRRNPWDNIPQSIRSFIRCFYCGKIGDANFRCRKLSSPHALATLEYRCLELLGKSRLDSLVRERPEMFRHLRDPDYVFK